MFMDENIAIFIGHLPIAIEEFGGRKILFKITSHGN